MKNILRKLINTLLLGSLLMITACNMNVNNQEKKTAGKVAFYVDGISAERTLFPQTEESGFNVQNLTDILLTWQKTGSSDSKRFETFNALSSCTLELDPGTWKFTLKGTINSVAFEGETEATVEENETTEVNFELSTDTAALKSTLKLKFSFPTEKNVKLLNGTMRYYYEYSQNSYTFDTNTVTGLVSVVDTENPETSYIVYETQWNSNINSCEFNFKFQDKDGNIAYCRESAVLEPGNTTSGEYTLDNFVTGYKINYYFTPEAEEPDYVDYYTTTEGYTLYATNTYSWYTDRAGTIAATSKGVGQSSGDLNFYNVSTKIYRRITIKDLSNNVLYTSLLEAGKSYYLNSNYISLNNEGTYYLQQQGKYFTGTYYTDINKSNYKNTYNSYYPEEDVVLYVEFLPLYKVTLISLNSGETIDERYCCSYYGIYSNRWYTYNQTYYYTGITVKACYKNSNRTGAISFDNSYTLTEDTVLYVDDEVKVTHYITFVDQNDQIIVTKPIYNYYYVFNTSYTIDGTGYSFESGYVAETFYSNYNRTEKLYTGSWYYNNSKDITVYVDYFQKISATVSSVSYNKAYKISAQGENSRLLKIGSGVVDSNGDYKWYADFSSNTSSSSSSKASPEFYYTPIDTTAAASYSGEWEEILPSNETAYTADTTKAKNNVSKYIVSDTDDMIVAYKYQFEKDQRYDVEIINSNRRSSLIPNSTYCYFYVVDETTGKYVTYFGGGDGYFTAPSTGVYTLYVYANNNNSRIKCGHHVYSIDYCTPEYNITCSNQDISITKTENTTSVILSAPEGYSKYQWLIGNSVVGNASTFTLSKAEISSYEVVPVTLRAKNTYLIWYSTTIFVESNN